MKKTLVLLSLMAAGATMYAQTGAGSIMLGTNISYSSTTNSVKIDPAPPVAPADAKSSSMNFGVNGGYFVMDDLAVGIMLSYGTTTTPNSGNDGNGQRWSWDEKNSGLTFGVFGRKYFEVGDKFKMWGQGSFTYSSGTSTSSSIQQILAGPPKVYAVVGNPDATTTGMGINITPGFTYFAGDSWGIDFALANLLGYNSNTSKTTAAAPATGSTEFTTSTLGININTLTPTIGIYYYMGK